MKKKRVLQSHCSSIWNPSIVDGTLQDQRNIGIKINSLKFYRDYFSKLVLDYTLIPVTSYEITSFMYFIFRQGCIDLGSDARSSQHNRRILKQLYATNLPHMLVAVFWSTSASSLQSDTEYCLAHQYMITGHFCRESRELDSNGFYTSYNTSKCHPLCLVFLSLIATVHLFIMITQMVNVHRLKVDKRE